MPVYLQNGKKNGKKKYRVEVSYVASDGNYKKIVRTVYGSENAKDLERDLLLKIETDGIEKKPQSMTMDEIFAEYQKAKKFEIRETTSDKNHRNYNLYVKPFLGECLISEFDSPKLQKWKNEIEHKGLALKTKNHAYSILRSIFNFAVKMDYLKTNPLLKVGNFKETLTLDNEERRKNTMKVYAPEDFKKFISIAKQQATDVEHKMNNLSEWDYYVFFNIAFFTGMRKGEIHALKWSDVRQGRIFVSRSINQKLVGGDRETPPKNRSSIRDFEAPAPLLKVLDEHKKRQQRVFREFSDDFRVCGALRSVRDSTLSNRLKKYALLAGVDVIKVHDFRHSSVSVLANAGINIQEIARRMGHSRVEETWNTYSHMYSREEERSTEILNKIFI